MAWVMPSDFLFDGAHISVKSDITQELAYILYLGSKVLGFFRPLRFTSHEFTVILQERAAATAGSDNCVHIQVTSNVNVSAGQVSC